GVAVRYHVTAELARRSFRGSRRRRRLREASLARAGDAARARPAGRRRRRAHPAAGPALERHVAEKLHADARSYAAGRPSTRVKDLVDLVVMATCFPSPRE